MAIVVCFAIPLADIGGSIRRYRRAAGALDKVSAACSRDILLSKTGHCDYCESGRSNHE